MHNIRRNFTVWPTQGGNNRPGINPAWGLLSRRSLDLVLARGSLASDVAHYKGA